VITLDRIDLGLASTAAPEALAELNRQLADCTAVTDAPLFLDELLARHALGACCLDQEIAIPHARTTAVKRLVIAVGRSQAGVHFDPKYERIRLIFLIGVPPGLAEEYLKTVAQLTRMVRDRTLRNGLLAAERVTDFEALWAGGVAQLAR